VKNFIRGAVTAVAVLVVGALGYFGLGFAPMGADFKLPAWEARLMTSAVHASVRRNAPELQGPPVTDELLVAGAKRYLNDCVGCHGAPGQPPSDFGATFYPPAPQFPLIGTEYTEAQVFWVAKHGVRRTGMSPQGLSYTDEKLWTLAAFIKGMGNLPPAVSQAIQPQPSK
jgi:mono/diheme cytochrome c family protein